MTTIGLVLGLASVGAWGGWAWRTRALRSSAEVEARAGRWDRAEAELVRLAWYRPDDPEVLRLRVHAAGRRGDVPAALQLLDRVDDRAPDAAGARLIRARFLMQAFRLREAEADLRRALGLDPGLDEARQQLLTIYGLERRADDFEREARALAARGEAPLEGLRLLAQSGPAIPFGTLKADADEGLILEGALKVDPDDPHLRPALARFYRDRGRIDDARRLLGPWLREHPDDRAAAEEWVACLLDDDDDALRPWFEPPRPALAGSPAYWGLRGEWYDRQGRTDDALASFREAARLGPQDDAAQYRLGQALLDAGRADEAAGPLARAERLKRLKADAGRIPLRPTDPATLLELGRLCEELGRPREARGWYALAVRVAPRSDEARAAYARAAARR